VSWSGRVKGRLGRSKATVATVAAVAALGAGLGGIAPAVISALRSAAPVGVAAGQPAPLTGVPVKVDIPGKAAAPKTVSQATRTYRATAAHWPAAASGSVLVTAAAAGQADGPKASIPGTPLWVQSVGTGRGATGTADAARSSEVSATVLPHSQAAALGVSGLVLNLGGQAPGTGKVRVGLDYASFAQVYGGNYGTRLDLVELPGCALTTPQLAACRVQTPVGSVQDYKGTTVSAVVTLGQAAAAATMSYSGHGASAGVVLAATSTTGSEGGAAGEYPPTKLEPDGTWAEGGASGSFNYTYPITVPPARGSLTPSVTLDYDSQSVDGTTATTQAQANWLGDGWSTPDSSIELETTACADNPEGSASPVTNTGDMCYDGEILQMDLNGSDTPLVFVSSSTSGGVTTSTWQAQDDSGDVITHVAPGSTVFDKYSTSSPGSDYWTVTERDGTEYEFGLQHLPGYASGDASTNSVDWMPVYSAHSGDPCYNSGGFTASVCTMAYQWHLDYVKDVHSDAMAYFYDQTTNYYGEDNGASDVEYISDSYLDHIAYGFTDGHAYGNPPDLVNFGTSARCTATTCGALSTSNPNVSTQYPDVPVDLICASGAKCTGYSPSLFSQVRLTSVTAQQYNVTDGAYQNVDGYAFDQTEPASGDGLSPTLWLDSITRTGDDTTAGGSSSPIALPAVSFTGVDMQNRVFTTDYPGLYRYRIAQIKNETGGVVDVSYGTPDACSSSYSSASSPSVTSANTDSCYPVEWTPPGNSVPTLDWFESYVVTQVISDDTTGGAPNQETDYSYGGAAAWHYDDNLTVEPKYRTWGQFRGYASVTTETGQAASVTQSKSTTTYYRGMNGDPLPSGTASVTLTDSQGGAHADADQLAGDPLETSVYDGAGGPVVNSTITSYWISGNAADMSSSQLPVLGTGSPSLPDLTANMVQTAETWTRAAVTDGGETGDWDVTETDNTYDTGTGDAGFGLLLYSYGHTDPVNAAYDSCAQDQYAPANTSLNLVGLVSYTEIDQVACSGYTAGSVTSVPDGLNTLGKPASVSASQVGKATETFYDDPSFSTTFPQPAAPKTADATMTRQASGGSPGSFSWQTESRLVYDSYGRATGSYDALGNETVTSYTDNSAGETTAESIAATPTTYDKAGTTVTTDHVTSQTFDPTRGLELTSTDQNGIVTTEQYDALGRLTSVWESGRPTSAPANITDTYTVSNTGLSGVVTDTLNAEGNNVPSSTIYDSLGRTRQTQSLATTATGDGRNVTDTLYDSRGWTEETVSNYYDSSSLPALTLFNTPVSEATDVDEYTYDGTGRQVEDTSVDQSSAIETTVTAYNGDSITTIPGLPGVPSAGSAAIPAKAGVVQTTTTNPVGQQTAQTEYTADPTLTIPSNPATGSFSISGGTANAITYAYDAAGNEVKESLGGSSWTQAYNLLGQETQTTGPASGTTTMQYDADGNLLQTKDAAGDYTSYTYDQDNRKAAEYASPTGSGNQIPFGSAGANETASWVYDNANAALSGTVDADGQETTAYTYANGYSYKTQELGYTPFGESAGEVFYLPSGAPGAGLGSALGFANTYEGIDGELVKQSFPAGGGLPAETVTYSSTSALDLPSAVGGLTGYAEGTTYDSNGLPEQVTLGSGSDEASVTDTYDPRTNDLTGQKVANDGGTALDDVSYGYDAAGVLTSETDERNGSTAQEETQCYAYTTDGQLSQAWTATDACAATPTTSSHSTVGDGISSGDAYDETLTYNALGEPASKTAWVPSAAAYSTSSYTYSPADPTELTATATTGAVTGSTSYAYNADGQQDSRTTAAGTQTLAWGADGTLTGVDTSSGSTAASYVYDANGNLFAATEGTTTTVYLPSEQLTINTSGNTLSGVRTYNLPGGITAVRTGSGSSYGFEIESDQHGTDTLYLDDTAQKPTWRQFDPFGSARGTAPASGTFPGSRGLLNDPVDPVTGLTSVGDRWYDSSTGSFVSLDPLLEATSELGLNGYTYAGMNPVANSDPTGNMLCMAGGPCGSVQALEQYANAQQAAQTRAYDSLVSQVENQEFDSECSAWCHPQTIMAQARAWNNPEYAYSQVSSYIDTAEYDAQQEQQEQAAAAAAAQRQQHHGWLSSVLTHVAAWTGDVGDAVGDMGAVATLLGAPEFGETLSGVSAALDVVSAAADFANGNDEKGLLELGSGALMVFTGGLGSIGSIGKFAGLGDEAPEAFGGLSGAFVKIAQEAKDIPDMRDPSVIIRSAQCQKIWGYGGAVLVSGSNVGLQKLTWSRLP
jgi:RHS repeat-associated protein